MARKAKQKADCRADTRGGGFAGIPVCLIESPAYRDLSLWARAVLVELAARMRGYNNGKIALSVAEICTALGNSNRKKASAAIAELMEHGILDLCADAIWKERKAREYRLTFVSTREGPFIQPATNDYLRWTPKAVLAKPGSKAIDEAARSRIIKSRTSKKTTGNEALPAGGSTGNEASPERDSTGNAVLPGDFAHRRKTAKNGDLPSPVAGNEALPLISKPYLGTEMSPKRQAKTPANAVGQNLAPSASSPIDP